jgi:tetratricopeptide (TPR) repeat protein
MPFALGILGDVYKSMGTRNTYLDYQRQQIASDPERLAAFEKGLAEAGFEGAQRALADLLSSRYEAAGGAVAGGQGPIAISDLYLLAGDHQRAIDWLEEAFDTHNPNLPYLGVPVYDPLRANPRFQDLLRKMNLPTDNSPPNP